jgi:hypothetical protein
MNLAEADFMVSVFLFCGIAVGVVDLVQVLGAATSPEDSLWLPNPDFAGPLIRSDMLRPPFRDTPMRVERILNQASSTVTPMPQGGNAAMSLCK